MERDEHIADLFRKYLADDYTKAELDEILRYFRHPVDESRLDELVAHELGRLDAIDADRQALVDSISGTVERRVFSRTRPTVRKPNRWLPYAAAAAILLAATAAWWAISLQQSAVSTDMAEILPGGNRATLTLADGRTIDLDEAQTGIVVGAEDITYDDGSVVSTVDSPHAGLTTYDLQLTTPKGGQYQVTLPDGSKVWLNSASTLKYPSRFANDSREVILEGEAFFEIKEIQGTPKAFGTPAGNLKSSAGTPNTYAGARVSRVPFKVQTSSQTVDVLGTQFNISAYADDTETKTTLVSGKVRVVGAVDVGANNHSPDKSGVTLNPGQQATTRGAATTINTVDPDQYTAWKSGLFRFGGEPLEHVMKQVSRWYDVDVAFADDRLRTIPVEGIVDRYDNLATLLRLFESVGDVRFTVQGRKLTVNPKSMERDAPM